MRYRALWQPARQARTRRLGNRCRLPVIGLLRVERLSASPRPFGPRLLCAPMEEEVGDRHQAADDHHPGDVDRWFPGGLAVLEDESTHRSGAHAEAPRFEGHQPGRDSVQGRRRCRMRRQSSMVSGRASESVSQGRCPRGRRECLRERLWRL